MCWYSIYRGKHTANQDCIHFKRGICLWNNLPQSTSTKIVPIDIAASFVFSACLIVMFIVLCLNTVTAIKRLKNELLIAINDL